MKPSRRARSRRLKRIAANALVIVLSVLALLLLVGLFLPGQYRVERSLAIRAKAEAVYPYLAGLRTWPEWTVWNQEVDPGVKFTYESPDTGAGAVYRWEGPKLGRGLLRLTRAETNKGVWYDLDFDNGDRLSTGSLTLDETPEGARVTWVNEGELGRSPFSRYAGLFLERIIGPDFDKGLANLKAKVEGVPPASIP